MRPARAKSVWVDRLSDDGCRVFSVRLSLQPASPRDVRDLTERSRTPSWHTCSGTRPSKAGRHRDAATFARAARERRRGSTTRTGARPSRTPTSRWIIFLREQAAARRCRTPPGCRKNRQPPPTGSIVATCSSSTRSTARGASSRATRAGRCRCVALVTDGRPVVGRRPRARARPEFYGRAAAAAPSATGSPIVRVDGVHGARRGGDRRARQLRTAWCPAAVDVSGSHPKIPSLACRLRPCGGGVPRRLRLRPPTSNDWDIAGGRPDPARGRRAPHRPARHRPDLQSRAARPSRPDRRAAGDPPAARQPARAAGRLTTAGRCRVVERRPASYNEADRGRAPAGAESG